MIVRERKLREHFKTSHLGERLVGEEITAKVKELSLNNTSRKQQRGTEAR